MATYPDDPDGAVLAQLAANGVDMTQPLSIDFPVVAMDEESAEAIAGALTEAGYDTEIVYDSGEPDGDEDFDEEDCAPAWDVYVRTRMVPDYDAIVGLQKQIDEIVRPLGGESDGWGVMLDGDSEP